MIGVRDMYPAGPTQSSGWSCPRCMRIHAPSVASCAPCNAAVLIESAPPVVSPPAYPPVYPYVGDVVLPSTTAAGWGCDEGKSTGIGLGPIVATANACAPAHDVPSCPNTEGGVDPFDVAKLNASAGKPVYSVQGCYCSQCEAARDVAHLAACRENNTTGTLGFTRHLPDLTFADSYMQTDGRNAVARGMAGAIFEDGSAFGELSTHPPSCLGCVGDFAHGD